MTSPDQPQPQNLKPMYIVPILIEQPTWGGDYIRKFKQLTQSNLSNLKLGQSYELVAESLVYPGPFQPCYQITDDSSLANLESVGVPADSMPISQLIPDMSLLIKFTQAQENSYQVHIKSDQSLGDWQAKPESWFFFEA